MMMLVSLLLFGAAFAGTIFVMMRTLMPALPRIVALLSEAAGGGADEPATASVNVARMRMSGRQRPLITTSALSVRAAA